MSTSGMVKISLEQCKKVNTCGINLAPISCINVIENPHVECCTFHKDGSVELSIITLKMMANTVHYMRI